MRKVAGIVGLLAVASCDGRHAFDPSLPGTTPLNQLSTEQATRLCAEWVAYVKSSFPPAEEIEEGCRHAGIVQAANRDVGPTDAEVQSVCKAAYDQCKQDPPASVWGRPASVHCDNFTVSVGKCAGTVDEYGACVNEWGTSPRLPPCSQLSRARILDILAPAKAGPACKAFDETCPAP